MMKKYLDKGEHKMNYTDTLYKENIKNILCYGHDDVGDVRTVWADGTPAHSRFITQVCEHYNIAEGQFPLSRARTVAWKSGIKEVLWIYQDQSNDLDLLKDKYNITWWDSWDVGDRTIGQRYGATVKKYNLMDNLLNGLKNNPNGRRHIMSLWQEEDFNSPGLNPCAFQTIWTVRGEYLDLTLVQRSNDYLVAGHINKIQYVALQMMVAKATGYKAGTFCHFVQNLHIYDRHIDGAKELIVRFNEIDDTQPKLILDTDKTDFYSFTIDDFRVEDYEPIKPQIKFELAI